MEINCKLKKVALHCKERSRKENTGMEFQKVIEARRSMRKYDPNKEVSRELIEEMIAAAIEAPSWKNSQTARYYCVLSEELMDRVRIECLPEFNAKNSKDAKALVVTAFKKNKSGFQPDHLTPTNELGNGWGIYDLGLHNENFVLKAADLGLATLIMGIRDAGKLQEILHIPREEQVVSVIAVGYPADVPKKPVRKCIEEIAKFY